MSDFHDFLAPAKVNVFLHVTGQRPDGYHTLQSAFQLLDFYDTVSLKPTTGNQITRITPMHGIPAHDDLCVRAAQALQQASGYQHGVEIKLEKHIPMGGGLGGGSSDAATVLLALNQLWGLHLTRDALMKIGLSLGADVPFFIFGQNAWAEGIGEILTPLTLPAAYYVVLTPQIQVSTAKIFTHSRLTKDTKPLKIADFSNGANSSLFRNDLEKVVCEEFTAVASTLEWLNQYGQARMSGSGASVFVVVDSLAKAKSIFAKKPTSVQGFVAKALNQHPLYELAT
ncbi:MAG: 4-(cytidine 5'-diphospho)-2-C-methyl-D-erythritol kinase [Methylophilaceae bacterium]|jgi:4-diphosphocytidyl-2-C-methyl-D-erythritol kinase|nr:MAG: 4-(cytidine 5'-diphospho)-2-C-methyl-D-erythritol kinase [Methylophilaceae bacterium]